MAAITAAMVKELRERTGQAMMDCKKALSETDGDMEKAIDLLRKKGMAVMEKRGGRENKEGRIVGKSSTDGKKVVLTMPEVMECFHVTGEYDYLLKVIIRNREHLERFLVETLTPVPGMDKIRTSLVLREMKNTFRVPLIDRDD